MLISINKLSLSFIKEQDQINKFITESKRYFNLMFRRDRLSFITTPLNDMIGVTIAVALLWVGGNEVFYNASMNPNDFIKFIIFLFAIMEPAKSLAGVNLSIQTSLASAERVFKILQSEQQPDSDNKMKVDSFKSDIKIDRLNFNYGDNNRDVLKIANALAEITSSDAYKKSLH